MLSKTCYRAQNPLMMVATFCRRKHDKSSEMDFIFISAGPWVASPTPLPAQQPECPLSIEAALDTRPSSARSLVVRRPRFGSAAADLLKV